uniref:Uncharacterized protein n=1 Tax=Arundo donax TaxID=35708 RepID=A0A0A9G062_ARUDO
MVNCYLLRQCREQVKQPWNARGSSTMEQQHRVEYFIFLLQGHVNLPTS